MVGKDTLIFLCCDLICCAVLCCAVYSHVLWLLTSTPPICPHAQIQGVLPAVFPDQLLQLLNATAPFQNAYLGACLSRMSDSVVAAFPGGTRSLPSPADVQKCIG